MASVGTRPKGEDQEARSAVTRLFDDTRRRLVETGTRNRLVHVNRANTRGNVLNIVNEHSDDVHALLSGGKTMRFFALGKDKVEDSREVILADGIQQGSEEDRRTDSWLETRLGPDALQKKLLKIAREAQTAEEESGVNVLYLAMGFLTWYEDKASSLPREAPLVLLPVELVRNARTSTFDLRVRDEDALTNLPLQQRLRDDFGIELPELEIEEDWNPSDYFTEVQLVTNSRERWKLDPDAIQLGFFSFSKLLMYRDLAIEAWPDDALANHALTRGLLYEGFEREEPLFASDDKLDAVLPPEKLFHVVDADASQAKVIEEVRSGRNLVVQGPPGTGKSQTITNIIAAAAKEGKRVLFLAEKMAALSVVNDRLVKVGLRDVCLELHSRSANKKAVLGELARTLSQASVVPGVPGAPTALRESRDRLNSIAEALHRPIGATGETAYSVLGRQSQFIGKGISPPNLEVESLNSMSRQQEIDLLTTIEEYGALLAEEGRATSHPFEGTGNLHLQPVDLARLMTTLTEAQNAATSLATSLRVPFDALALPNTAALDAVAPLADVLGRLEGLPPNATDIAQKVLDAPDISRLHQALRAGMAWRQALDQASEIFVEAAFSVSSSHLRPPLAAGIPSFFIRWGGRYRGASRELAGLLRGGLPKTATERVARIDQLTAVTSLRSEWEDDREYCGRILGDVWRGEKSDFGKLVTIVEWCERLSKAPISVPSEKSIALERFPLYVNRKGTGDSLGRANQIRLLWL
ncbi:DUF4011 domain-containing protein [Bradyrhizobium sp. CCGUVB14]|uniref:DUF4011 domain-containing protein n=1 Tax=Bradyrhizobium sp. CCGUVB14 TaxID=2949628 RepID=UPI0020B1B401|nr:DUF4011 domain-containing protein [Bradyrhizobium sp. CCGUVB14]MCP3442001.1 DUF4011 domain-containing protein [Bradyrhizobium sp. CCGUVB14]